MSVSLRPITHHNWREATQLKVRPDQAHFIASNTYSIAESQFLQYDPDGLVWNSIPLAVYADTVEQ
jgi:hypothetical protein